MSDLNIRFSNCFNFINNTKRLLEVNPTDWRNIYTEEALAYAECDLMEMELDALYDTEEYHTLLNGNAFRTSKRTQRRKQNKKHHKADRYHGKTVPQSDKKYWDEQSGTFYRWDEKRKTFSSPKKPKIHRNKKTFRDRLNHSMREREIDFLSAMEILDRSNAIFFQAKEETDPIRQKQLEDTAYELLCAGCVDFYHGAVTGHKGTYFPDLAVGN